MKTNSKDRTGSQLVDMADQKIFSRVGALVLKFQTVLPTFLTNDLLAIAEKFPDQFELVVKQAFNSKRFGLEVRVAGLSAIEKAQEYVGERFTESLTLGSVAKTVAMSPFFFCKLFKKQTGLHFTEFVSKVRIGQAKNFLLNPHYRIGEIAGEVGFKSLTHFNRVFKKLVGEAPTAYRKRILLADPSTSDIRTFAHVG